MYENLLYQKEIVTQLKHDVSSGALPPAILFSGQAMSGKLTAALETARLLSCRESGAWQCSCRLCVQHRELSHSRSILTGPRNMTPEIAAAANLLRQEVSSSSRFLLTRALRKLLRRFDPLLWEGNEKKISAVMPVLERLAENTDNLLSEDASAAGKKFDKKLDTLVEDSLTLQKYLPSILPVAQVRNINAWAAHSAGGEHKTVVFDSAERIPPAAGNALLKFLEEPPPDTTIILVTKRKSLLLPTIVSRLRDYAFRSRLPTEEQEILRRVFREKECTSLTEYFQEWSAGTDEQIRALAERFMESARTGLYPQEMSTIKDSMDFTALLDALDCILQEKWRAKGGNSSRGKEIAWLREARNRAENLNIPVNMLLRHLHLSLGTLP
ncbi:MAG: hypothetical protein B0D92_03810 [Spirochaeta sp. LUC14_002_19_P3]|nr:MAG: hypothetical protein B0D92_03810 [Spirochaeta sp. LUC14_002_19_P3]